MDKVRGVIFDLDGTVGNTLPLCIMAFKKAIEPLINRSLSDEEIVATFGPSEEGTIMALAPNHYQRGIKDYLYHYEALHSMCSSPFGGITELLQSLNENKVRTAMVTGKGNFSTELSLKQFKIKQYFEQIETGSPYGPRKPDGIKAVMHSFGDIAKEELVYVGDHPSDIIASREVGIQAIAAAWATSAEPHKLLALEPDGIFYTIPEFTEWLNKRI
ncbi:HAD family hydrolase [Muriicola sp. Z0-33]|uniref:HAD family hydrolase n=1 Tax=Muriicola sp. Z0-33 TaxID=2816957 RepID=UPI002237E5C3|nr:HAD family hydrolase [Muriicola sp. Z0-33]MCW5517389.1 HAD family hydrolase [Muriicola sp. Z0-33]